MPLPQPDPDHYPQLLKEKADRIAAKFHEFFPDDIDVFPSPPLHFRMRAEFRVWHQGNECFCVMFDPAAPRTPIRIDSFPVGSKLINRLLGELMPAINHSAVLKHKLFQLEFLTTLSGEALVSMIYHRPLDEVWQAEAEALQQQFSISIIGRSRKQKSVLNRDYVTEQLSVAGKRYAFQQVENSFTQPNARVNENMLAWALENSAGQSASDLLELYCGNGNFTAVLAQNFRRVLATEISKTSVRSAQHNFAANGVTNVEVVRMSSEDFTAALNKERPFRRLKEIDLDCYRFSTILVDPPRAGLDTATEQLVTRFDRILYISCNPDTLLNNLQSICKTHRIEKFALFDQFPYTDHAECGVLLCKVAP